MSARFKTVAVLGCTLVSVAVLAGQTTADAQKTRVERVAKLSTQLRWRDAHDKQRFDATKDETTKGILDEVDGAVTEQSFSAVTPARVKSELDTLVGSAPGALPRNVAFTANVRGDRFLIVGVEVQRGGEAISEDAISFRAYREQRGRLGFVAATELQNSTRTPYLVSLHAIPMGQSPIPGELWFLAWAIVPPQSPAVITAQLYAFDGEAIRTVWKPDDFTSRSVDQAVTATSLGFTIHRLFDPTGLAARSPSEVIHEQFALAVGGPVQVAEWRSPVQ